MVFRNCTWQQICTLPVDGWAGLSDLLHSGGPPPHVGEAAGLADVTDVAGVLHAQMVGVFITLIFLRTEGEAS